MILNFTTHKLRFTHFKLGQFIFLPNWLFVSQIKVTIAGMAGSEPVTCSRQVKIVPDTDLATALQTGPYDAIVMPGGMQGAKTFAQVSSSF